MISALCLNPSFDKTVVVDTLRVGKVNRVHSVRTDTGGKGTNVAIVLHRLGIPVRCLGLAGEDGAARYEQMLEQVGVPHGFLYIAGSLRTNLKVVSLDGVEVTEINEPGPIVDERRLKSFLKLVKDNCRGDEFLILTGSLPPGCGSDTYARLMRLLPIPCILDTSGDALRDSLEASPFLVKPNRQELENISGRTLRSLDEVHRAALELIDIGARNVLVSLGGEGAMLVNQNGALYAPGLKVNVSSTVGAGDAMTAGFVAGFSQTGDFRESLRRGMAAGAASVMTDGTQLIRLEDYQALLNRVVIEEV